ncbi:pullulanase [Bacillus sp. YZJH907-2]|uniref:pullulanase n=2 Tax=Halalkalibacter suaedae TaxID=2822140 RepID=A0A941AP97_9BACI|nr:pullulanase [Bacillus suaedae]
MVFTLIFSLFVQPIAQIADAAEGEQVYDSVVLRGSADSLDWSSDNNPLVYDTEEKRWISEPISLQGGEAVEFKFVMDGTWLEGENLTFTPPQDGEYYFFFDPSNERAVDVRFDSTKYSGRLTLEVTLPEETPGWITPTVASSLNGFNYTVTPMNKTEDGKWRIELAGEAGDTITYLYALGDKKFAEAVSDNRQAEFTAEGTLYEDTVVEWKAIPVAKNVSHDFQYAPSIPSSADEVTITTTVQHYGPITNGGIYYTIDGSSPEGQRGEATVGSFAPMEVSSSEDQNGLFTTIFTGVIPAQANETPVKYKVDVWDEAGANSQFADTNSQTAAEATEFAYYVDAFATPDWAKNATIYHIFVDRFKDGNTENNYDVNTSLPVEERLKGWMGGDLEGVIQELDYLDELGVDTLWLSPVFEGPYSHGYHPADFKNIDQNFGTIELMKELIDQAHAKGFKVIYDFVPNHTSEHHPYFQEAKKDQGSEYFDWYTFTNWPTEYNAFQGIGELPELNNDHPETREYILNDVVPFWLEELNFDGFRLDYAKGPSYSYWVDFRHAVKQLDEDAYIFGEVWDSREKINSYAGKLDGAVDFGFHDTAKSVFANDGSFRDLNNLIIENASTYHSEYIMTSFLDNHDVPRFLHAAENDVEKLKLASVAQFTLPGSPVIYYGTEVGLSQSQDHSNYTEWADRWYREMMLWEDGEQDLDLLQHYKDIIEMRNDHSTLRNGVYKDILVEQDVMAYERSDKNGTYLVVLNKSSETKTFDLAELYNRSSAESVKLTNLLTDVEHGAEDGKVGITIDSNAFAVYQLNGEFGEPSVVDPGEIPENTLRVHYERADNNFETIGLWLWDDVATPSTNWSSGATPFNKEQTDDYGAYVDVELIEDPGKVGFLLVDRVSGEKEGGDKAVDLSSGINEIWIKQGSDEVFTYEPVDLPENTVRIHYDRDDNAFNDLGVWVWEDVVAPSENWPMGAIPFNEEQMDRYGAYVDVELTEGAEKLGFLLVNRATGENIDGDKSFSLLDRYNRLWIKEGDDTVYTSPAWEVPIALQTGELLSTSKIRLGFTMTEGLNEEELVDLIQITDKDSKAVNVEAASITGDKTVEVTAAFETNKAPYLVTFGGKTVTAKAGWRMLDEMYQYDGDDLGATYHEDGHVSLKLWAPVASEVVVNFYDKADPTTEIGVRNLTKGEHGVWSVDITSKDLDVKDLRGYYYQYEVTNNGETKKVLDPYAKSMAPFTVSSSGETGEDGDSVGKAAIVDLAETNPEGFDFANIEGYEQREDAIIWEVHVRDFTSDPSIEEDLGERWGTYRAFIDKLDYIKSLGVTHVQLLPVMAWYYGNETNMGERELEYSSADNDYNWGYDPHNYFTPDGAYSENPEDAELRIKELKELIDAIHDAGMGVVLDNVYTHMASSSLLEDIVPDYYFWKNANGNFVGGFGNNLATNHKMAEKLMIDSVKYWFEEFKIDGMRWDMMGDGTYEAVQNAYDAAAEINPNALFIGEGWRTFSGHLADLELEGKGADQDWMDQTDSVGVFSDELRNELKSGFGSEGEPRFITGGARNIDSIFNNIKAQPSNTPSDDPGDMVQYIAAHDNLPLYDVIAQSIKKDPSVAENNLEIHKRIRIGNAMVLTSQGTAFIHAGQEYGRTKQWKGEGVPEQKYHELTDEDGNSFGYFIHDSYDSSDAINMFDWSKATDDNLYPVNHTTREYTAGLIKLRKSTNAFRLGTMDLVNTNVTLIEAPEMKETDLIIGFKNVSTDETGTYYTFINADNAQRTLTLEEDLTQGTIIVDNDEAGTVEVSSRSGVELTSNSIIIEPLTTVVIKVGGPPTTGTPGEPETPETPAPETPGEPERPETPAPGTPGEPERPETPAPGTPGESETPENPSSPNKQEDLVTVQPDITENIAKIKNDFIEKMTMNGTLELNLTENNEVEQVLLTNEQIKALKEKNGKLVLKNKHVELAIPVVIFPNEEITIELKRLKQFNNDISSVYNFTIFVGDDGEKLSSFEEGIELIFTVDTTAVKSLDTLKVFYLNEETNNWEVVGGSYKDGKVTATTTHFSTFTVLEAEEGSEVLPNTATSTYNGLLFGLLILVFGFVVALVSNRKKNML